MCGIQKVSKGRDSQEKANVVAIYLVCIRLLKQESDILITFNAPMSIHNESQAKPYANVKGTPEQNFKIFENIVQTFEIKNLSIFP